MVITGLVAFIRVYFGRLYLVHDPDEWRIANQQLGYALYIIPLIGVTHILGGVGLLIPNLVVSQFEISAPWAESGPLVIGHTDKCDAQIVSNLTVRRRLKLF